MLGILQPSADPPFLSKTSNAIAKKSNAKAKDGVGDPASNSIRRNQLVGGCFGVSKKEPQHFA
jgi:hypothetical protein